MTAHSKEKNLKIWDQKLKRGKAGIRREICGFRK
uniref:Uncharacterized protein n=1 Tax=Anguilla anguilla TaxID=7936 RepID=A0A0E9SWK9_ANGAN